MTAPKEAQAQTGALASSIINRLVPLCGELWPSEDSIRRILKAETKSATKARFLMERIVPINRYGGEYGKERLRLRIHNSLKAWESSP